MDLAEPARALSKGLTMPVLRALSQRSTPATATQVWRAARQGTLPGVQGTCERLVEHGLVEKDESAGRSVYSLNFDHLLYDATIALLGLEDALPTRLGETVAAWEVRPVTLALFGSAARGDGDVDSDIDVLLVRPPLPAPRRPVWARQVHALKHDVPRWTGNRLQVVDLTRRGVADLVRVGDPLVRSWQDEALTLYGEDLDDLIAGRA
ncbi:MAG TPA: nucleotidyltransferase domain-containing protein [Mycobacteriales bacterium]|jgi:hypothetical protein|nr:nucleotidyltransferase domain-containing protein [Mycobacteriales bacterium]